MCGDGVDSRYTGRARDGVFAPHAQRWCPRARRVIGRAGSAVQCYPCDSRCLAAEVEVLAALAHPVAAGAEAPTPICAMIAALS